VQLAARLAADLPGLTLERLYRLRHLHGGWHLVGTTIDRWRTNHDCNLFRPKQNAAKQILGINILS